MKFFLASAFSVAFLANNSATTLVHGHGYMFEPPSRPYYSWQNGLDFGSSPGVPQTEYCAWCINSNTGVCGITQGGTNYDDWLDSTGQSMPWISQETYQQGQIITVGTELTAHHNGHIELWACPQGRASAQDCFKSNKLEFVDDNTYAMPKDENHPQRGYLYGGYGFNDQTFSMRFKLPDNLVGEKVLLQWWYFTANSCSPEGYTDYFARNDLPSNFWSPGLATCTPDKFPDDFESGDTSASERFLNCAEVTILPRDGSPLPAPAPAVIINPTDPPVVAPVPSPTIAPVSIPVPVPVPVPVPTPTVIINPTTPPVVAPTAVPVPSPAEGCCSTDYKTCAGYCSDSQEFCEINPNCNNLKMKWLDNGADNGSCVSRWLACTDNVDSCCNGLICRGSSPYYKQCLSPTDPYYF